MSDGTDTTLAAMGLAERLAAERDQLRGDLTERDKAVVELHGALSELTTAFGDLIANSDGVAGLHLNGDIAAWSDLRGGGEFEDWLDVYDDAVDIAAKYAKPKAEADHG